MTLFQEEIENEAIKRITKFAKIAESLNFEISVAFSGGKDSQVVLDLCKRSGIQFKAYFNHSFESYTTLQFIRKYYPYVIWRRDYKFGFIENIWKCHNSLLPTTEVAYCCKDYKHNPKYIDNASITGVRKAESVKRKARKVFEAKNNTIIKQNKTLFEEYFTETCTGTGTSGIIQLKPIVDWSDENVWDYIKKYNLPINPEYKQSKRVGCMVCPKANFNYNFRILMQHPKLIDAFIKAREKRTDINWIIHSENKDYSNNKVEYICRWLNHSFRPFSRQQIILKDKVIEAYYNYLGIINNKSH